MESTMNYALWINQYAQMLQQLSHSLDKAEVYAQERKFDVQTLLQARLAPDQFPLVMQIQIACDNLKLAAARLSRTEAPRHEDTETTFAELKLRIASTITFVNSIPADAYTQIENIQVSFPWLPDMHLSGPDYFLKFAIPNIGFHLTTAYAILRHNGVPLGKQDFLAELPFKPGAAQNTVLAQPA